jgi:hypothetical protein
MKLLQLYRCALVDVRLAILAVLQRVTHAPHRIDRPVLPT